MSSSTRSRLEVTAKTAADAVTGVVGLVAAILGVVFLLVPEWRPSPRDKVEASLAVVDLENRVSPARWAKLQFPDDPDGALKRLFDRKPNRQEAHKAGSVVYVRLRADGFKRRSIRLQTVLYSAWSRRPSHKARSNIEFPLSGRVSIKQPSRDSVQLLFVDNVADIPEGTYFFRVFAFDASDDDDDAGVLAYADSKPFSQGRFVTFHRSSARTSRS